MPSYTYRCENCGHKFDRRQSYSDTPLKKCPQCGKHALLKVYKPARVLFKGSGYYVTDNRSKSRVSASSGNGKSEKSKKEKSMEASKEGGKKKETKGGKSKEKVKGSK